MKQFIFVLCVSLILLGLNGCATETEPEISYDPAKLSFDGQKALATEKTFVTQFPNRDSGQINNRLAAEWLLARSGVLNVTFLVCLSRPIRKTIKSPSENNKKNRATHTAGKPSARPVSSDGNASAPSDGRSWRRSAPPHPESPASPTSPFP